MEYYRRRSDLSCGVDALIYSYQRNITDFFVGAEWNDIKERSVQGTVIGECFFFVSPDDFVCFFCVVKHRRNEKIIVLKSEGVLFGKRQTFIEIFYVGDNKYFFHIVILHSHLFL